MYSENNMERIVFTKNNSVTENMFILYVLYVEKLVVSSLTLTPVQVTVNVTQITVLSDKKYHLH